MWTRKEIAPSEDDRRRWAAKRAALVEMATLSRGCIFAVDIHRGVYDYASEGFADLLGVQPDLEHGDFIAERIHPNDRAKIDELQISHGKFIQSLPPHERNDYRNIYQVRMLGSQGRYINVMCRNQVVETDAAGRAWIVMGMMELSPDQTPTDCVKCSVLNLRTGLFFNPYAESVEWALTDRELEVLSLMGQGLLSKEIAERLSVSKHTVDNHRKNILEKLRSNNAIEAINTARGAGLLY